MEHTNMTATQDIPLPAGAVRVDDWYDPDLPIDVTPVVFTNPDSCRYFRGTLRRIPISPNQGPKSSSTVTSTSTAALNARSRSTSTPMRAWTTVPRAQDCASHHRGRRRGGAAQFDVGRNLIPLIDPSSCLGWRADCYEWLDHAR